MTRLLYCNGDWIHQQHANLELKPSSGSTAIVLLWGGGLDAGGRDSSTGSGGGPVPIANLAVQTLPDLGATETIRLVKVVLLVAQQRKWQYWD